MKHLTKKSKFLLVFSISVSVLLGQNIKNVFDNIASTEEGEKKALQYSKDFLIGAESDYYLLNRRLVREKKDVETGRTIKVYHEPKRPVLSNF